MLDDRPRRALFVSPILWSAVATFALFTAIHLGRAFGLRSGSEAPWHDASWGALFFGWLVTLAVAALSTWRLVRAGSYSGLLVLGAACLVLVEPGRAGHLATWRVEWGVFGTLWTAAAIAVFTWLLARQDERARRIHSEGAALGLAIAVSVATVYALFEGILPPLDGQRVALSLLASWLCGRLITSYRYR